MIAASDATAQKPVPPTAQELAAITERGILLNEYDQAAWHATDAVSVANPKKIQGQHYLAKKRDGKWIVVFGRLNADKTAFEIYYEALQQRTKLKEFDVEELPNPRIDTEFFLFAARALELAIADFSKQGRPYNGAVLPAPEGQLYVYLYPAQTDSRIYPLGGDVRYLVSEAGTRIVERRQMHKAVLDTKLQGPKGVKPVLGLHTHTLSDIPEDTDVFHVLTQDPRTPEMVTTPHFVFKILMDGTITIEKTRN
jgi:hypothetical protein